MVAKMGHTHTGFQMNSAAIEGVCARLIRWMSPRKPDRKALDGGLFPKRARNLGKGTL